MRIYIKYNVLTMWQLNKTGGQYIMLDTEYPLAAIIGKIYTDYPIISVSRIRITKEMENKFKAGDINRYEFYTSKRHVINWLNLTSVINQFVARRFKIVIERVTPEEYAEEVLLKDV